NVSYLTNIDLHTSKPSTSDNANIAIFEISQKPANLPVYGLGVTNSTNSIIVKDNQIFTASITLMELEQLQEEFTIKSPEEILSSFDSAQVINYQIDHEQDINKIDRTKPLKTLNTELAYYYTPNNQILFPVLIITAQDTTNPKESFIANFVLPIHSTP
ncbi:MAG: hypothetical protein NZL93_01340, partial [Chthoniobacterales bacterium]|nr:hypothetical protein [Chthoniobacterales bacterium]